VSCYNANVQGKKARMRPSVVEKGRGYHHRQVIIQYQQKRMMIPDQRSEPDTASDSLIFTPTDRRIDRTNERTTYTSSSGSRRRLGRRRRRVDDVVVQVVHLTKSRGFRTDTPANDDDARPLLPEEHCFK
jgi:hypothetical protein